MYLKHYLVFFVISNNLFFGNASLFSSNYEIFSRYYRSFLVITSSFSCFYKILFVISNFLRYYEITNAHWALFRIEKNSRYYEKLSRINAKNLRIYAKLSRINAKLSRINGKLLEKKYAKREFSYLFSRTVGQNSSECLFKRNPLVFQYIFTILNNFLSQEQGSPILS